MTKILIVEDDVSLRNELKIFLENNGYEVNLITDFNDTLNQILSTGYDILLLDVNLPNLNGEFIMKEIRKVNNKPVIILTSKTSELDELICINYGADDFITKPYNPQILLARINRLINRTNNNNYLTYLDLTLDVSKSIITKGSEKQELSRNEFKIFYFLLQNKGKIVSRDELIDYLWDNNEFVDDNTLTVNINRLRQKLLTLGYENIIDTRRGQGYIIL